MKTWIVGAIVPVVLTLLAVTHTMTFDAAISVVETILAVSPIPVIILNYRQKIGQSKLTMVTLTSGLLSIGTMFLLAGFVLTALATIMSGVLWGAVAAEAFLYAKPKTADPMTERLEFLKTHGHGEHHEEGLERCQACVTHRFLGLQPPLFWGSKLTAASYRVEVLGEEP